MLALRGPQWPIMADTHAAGTVECEVQAGTSDDEGCGMDSSDDFEVFEETAVLGLGVGGVVADGPGLATAGGGRRRLESLDSQLGFGVGLA